MHICTLSPLLHFGRDRLSAGAFVSGDGGQTAEEVSGESRATEEGIGESHAGEEVTGESRACEEEVRGSQKWCEEFARDQLGVAIRGWQGPSRFSEDFAVSWGPFAEQEGVFLSIRRSGSQ